MSCDQTASTSNAASTSSVSNEDAAMNTQIFEEISLSQKNFDRHIVRAAELLVRDSSTEIVEVSKLSKRCKSLIRYVEIGAVGGLLYCIDNLMSTACWMKVVPFANDCHSHNVLLTFTTGGVKMKATRNINLGEELLMWFDNDMLSILHMLFLRPSNIQGYNRYVCHICNKGFEFPNPLKVHIALKCDQVGINYLWAKLQNGFNFVTRLQNTQSVAVPANCSSHQLVIETIIDNLEKTSEGYACFYCGKVYVRKHTLKVHIRSHTGIKVFKCIYCHQTFGRHSDWSEHLRTHVDNVNYVE